MHIIIVTGLSGSGKTLTLNTLEDQNYSCIDNLPPELLPKLLDSAASEQRQKIAIGMDIRSGAKKIQALPQIIKETKARYKSIDIVYLYADTRVIKKRYNETRRRHPLSSGKQSLAESLKKEKKILDCISNIADLRIDTSKTDIYQLSYFVKQRLCQQHHIQGISLMFQSFGFKYSAPSDSDFMFDVRCLPNPYWVNELREFSGQDQPIKDWLKQHDSVQNMISDITHFLKNWIPPFEENQKAYMTISIGCTGGHHRSVYITEQLAYIFESNYHKNTLIHHRELYKK
jgi:UPF0042 nucleotide-binding protein